MRTRSASKTVPTVGIEPTTRGFSVRPKDVKNSFKSSQFGLDSGASCERGVHAGRSLAPIVLLVALGLAIAAIIWVDLRAGGLALGALGMAAAGRRDDDSEEAIGARVVARFWGGGAYSEHVAGGGKPYDPPAEVHGVELAGPPHGERETEATRVVDASLLEGTQAHSDRYADDPRTLARIEGDEIEEEAEKAEAADEQKLTSEYLDRSMNGIDPNWTVKEVLAQPDEREPAHPANEARRRPDVGIPPSEECDVEPVSHAGSPNSVRDQAEWMRQNGIKSGDPITPDLLAAQTPAEAREAERLSPELDKREDAFCGRYYGIAHCEADGPEPLILFDSKEAAEAERARRHALDPEGDDYLSSDWQVFEYDIEGTLWNSYETNPRPAPTRSRLYEMQEELDRLKAELKANEETLVELAARAQTATMEREEALLERNDGREEIKRMTPVVEAAERWRDGVDRGELAATVDALRGHGPLGRSDLRGLAARESMPAVVVQGGHEGEGPAIWDLVIAELEEQSPKNPRSEEAQARRRRIADDARARDAFGAAKYGRRLRVNDGRDALIDSYQEDLDSLVYKRKAVEEGRACQGLYQRALEQVIATKAQIELDAAQGIGGAQ